MKLTNIKMAKWIIKEGQTSDDYNIADPNNLEYHIATNVMGRTGRDYSYLKELGNRIGKFESRNRNIEQILDNGKQGEGSGLFQFQYPSMVTAAGRLLNIHPSASKNPDIAKILSSTPKDGLRASEFPPAVQRSLLYANLQQAPGTRLSKKKNEQTFYETWAEGHHLESTRPHYNRWKTESDLNNWKDYPENPNL